VSNELLPIIFLDANVLAKPTTRTLLLRCAPGCWIPRWSLTVESEANRHLPTQATKLAEVRELTSMDISPIGAGAAEFAETSASDRQVLADARAAGARYLITENVADFGASDLERAGMLAVIPDLFLAERTSEENYQLALASIVSRMRNPARTIEQLHRALGRQHPRLTHRFADLFSLHPELATQAEPLPLFRGSTCLRCHSPRQNLSDMGICGSCKLNEHFLE